jgi:hypothetical protein
MVAATPFEGMVTENPYSHIRLWQRYATRCVKKEFSMNGSNGISFPTHLSVKRRCGTHLRPLKLKAIGTSWQRSFARSSLQLSRFNTKEASDHFHARRRGRDRPSLE